MSLTPANQSLIESGSLEKLRVLMGRDLTPRPRDITDYIVWIQHDLIVVEEYGHPTLSRDEVIRRNTERLDLAMRALKESLITDIKCQRGEWIATA